MKYVYIFVVVTVFFACSKNDPFPQVDDAFGTKLTVMTTYLQAPDGSYTPGEKIEYAYFGGKLNSEIQSEYDVTTKSFTLFSTTRYFYNNGNLDRIEKQFADVPNKVITRYEFADQKVARITRDDEVDTDAIVKYLAGDTVEVLYNHSNGRFFTYKFKSKDNNITFERTFDEANKVTSETTNEFDNHNNPLKLLGYTDLLFGNYSVNNKTKTSASYLSGGFPTLTPVSYEYEYNDAGYPTSQITTYKTTGGSDATRKTKTVYEYSGVN